MNNNQNNQNNLKLQEFKKNQSDSNSKQPPVSSTSSALNEQKSFPSPGPRSFVHPINPAGTKLAKAFKSSNDKQSNNLTNQNNKDFKLTDYKNRKRKYTPSFKAKTEFEEKLVDWKRVSKTTKGGRQGRVWTLVVVGNRKGSIGFGIGKADEFPDAMKKAVKNALKNVVKVKINANGTVYHENIGKHCASVVLIKPAKIGIGIIAGGAIKTVLELAGYTDIYSKNLGSSTSMNMVQAAINALLQQRTPAEVARLRDKKITDL